MCLYPCCIPNTSVLLVLSAVIKLRLSLISCCAAQLSLANIYWKEAVFTVQHYS